MTEVSLENLLQFVGELYIEKRMVEGKLAELQEKMEAVFGEVSKLKSAEGELATVRTQFEQLVNETQAVKRECEELKKQIESRDDYIEWIEQDVKKVIDERDALRKELEELKKSKKVRNGKPDNQNKEGDEG